MGPRFLVAFQPSGRRVEVDGGSTLLDASRAAGLELASDCGGEGSCGRCRVRILSGELSEAGESERNALGEKELEAGGRLACRAQVLGNLSVYVPASSTWQVQRLQLAGDAADLTVDAPVVARRIQLSAPTLVDPKSDEERVLGELSERTGVTAWQVDLPTVRQLSPLARQEAWSLSAYLRGSEVVGFGRAGKRPLGFAVDLGSTKIAGYLLDLESGKELGSSGAMNPQIGYGEDVIARLAHACRSPSGAAELSRSVRRAVNDLAGKLLEGAGASPDQLVEACLVGNTAMTHLFLNLPVQQLAVSPFVAALGSALDVKAREVDLDAAPGAYVHILPCIGGFVGADHVAMILGSGLDRRGRVALGVDIGTNTEIVITGLDGGVMASASCASGPAFEGAHIRHGMRAAPGAIEAVRWTKEGVEFRTILDAPPSGLCGSGIVDAVAALSQARILDERGRLQRDGAGVRDGEKGSEFVLVPGHKSGTGQDIVISQRDVSEIQLAKAAILAGIQTLMAATDTAEEDVEEVVIAGAFGSYLNVESALQIGLLPRLPKARYLQIGNAAGVGAKMALVSGKQRDRAAEIARRARYLELNTDTGFGRRFTAGLRFPQDHGPWAQDKE